MLRRYWLAAALSFVLVACSKPLEPQRMYDSASALTKLTAHVDAAVVYGPSVEGVSDQALLDKAFEDNPTLKPQLGSQTIHLQRGDKGVVLMLCSADGATSLLEDLSCTPGMDKHHWRDEPGRSCTFALSPAACD